MFGNTFKNRIFTYYLVVFVFFTAIIVVYQFSREKEYRKNQFDTVLDHVSVTTHKYIEKYDLHESGNYDLIDSLVSITPLTDVRITLIDNDGMVLYDSSVENYLNMENHADRPEVQIASREVTGSSVRISATTGKEYFYHAHKYDKVFIRVAAEYTFEVRSLLKIDMVFLFVILILFILVMTAMFIVNNRFGRTIVQLRNFATAASDNQDISSDVFPRNEMGLVGSQIIEIFNDLKEKSNKLYTDREKMFRHLEVMEEGIAIFSPDRELILSNTAFIQNANIISKNTLESPKDVLKVKEIKSLMRQMKKISDRMSIFDPEKSSYKEIVVKKNNRYFLIRVNIFRDYSFELILKDVTKTEKNRVMKQEITSNIAHELRTPVTSILGYLETLIGSSDLEEERKNLYIERAKDQSIRLANLIEDISVLNKLEDGSEMYQVENLELAEIITNVIDSFRVSLGKKNIDIHIDDFDKVRVPGNRVLLHSIFQNLIENTINYGGEGISIWIKLHYQDDNNYFISYSNSGNTIPEEHLQRLFERFYRIDDGRSREKGGTGLGLAIVKHAVLFHNGQINVKNRQEGGVEFLFSLGKSR